MICRVRCVEHSVWRGGCVGSGLSIRTQLSRRWIADREGWGFRGCRDTLCNWVSRRGYGRGLEGSGESVLESACHGLKLK